MVTIQLNIPCSTIVRSLGDLCIFLFHYPFCTNIYKSHMYIWYYRLDIDTHWFKLEATTPFELETSMIDSTCLTWWLCYTKTHFYFILTCPPHSYQLMWLKYSLYRLGTNSWNPTGSLFGQQGHRLHRPNSQRCCNHLRLSQQHTFLPIHLSLPSHFVGRLRDLLSDTCLSRLDLFPSHTSLLASRLSRTKYCWLYSTVDWS
jgi:hypothetical protein